MLSIEQVMSLDSIYTILCEDSLNEVWLFFEDKETIMISVLWSLLQKPNVCDL